MTLGLNHLKSHLFPFFAEFDCLNLVKIDNLAKPNVPVMAAIALRKKVISIGCFSPWFRLQSLQTFLLVRLNQEQLYVLIAPKNRTEPNELDELKYSKSLNQIFSYAH